MTCILTKFLFGRLAKARGQKPCQKHTIRGLRPKLRRDWEHENESKNFEIFKEISGFLGSSLGICTKLQLAALSLTVFRANNGGAIEEAGCIFS